MMRFVRCLKLLHFYFSLIFLVQDQKSGFHVWGSLQRMEKTKIKKGNPLFCTTVLIGRISGNNFKYRQKLIQAESTVQPDK